MTGEAGHTEGLIESLRNLAKTFVAILQTRLEIFASEIDEQRALLVRITLLTVVAGFCLGVAAVLFVFFLVVYFWDSNRLLAIGLPAGLFAAAGIAAGLMLRAAIVRRPKLLSATLAELRKDRKALDGQ
jgi:uncharacterized membrane protein YqjE